MMKKFLTLECAIFGFGFSIDPPAITLRITFIEIDKLQRVNPTIQMHFKSSWFKSINYEELIQFFYRYGRVESNSGISFSS